ncbi:MAG: MBL fold metallo-hydrolase [Bacteroidales bacterium]|nr:MBL fold metallo-hydrolase [Bacteroidales bacterium]
MKKAQSQIATAKPSEKLNTEMTRSNLEVVFLGTGTSIGVPVIACDCPVCCSQDMKDKRFRSSILVRKGETTLVIDCGPDFRFQMLKQKVENIDAVVFTHEHRDHIAGLDDVRAFNYIWNKRINIYGCKRVMDSIRNEFPYIFNETRFFGAPQLDINVIDNKPFEVKDMAIEPIEVMHNKLCIFGYRIDNFTYITDASAISETEKAKIKGTKTLVINALRNSKHVSHFSLKQALGVIDEIQPQTAYLTHISHFLGIHEEVQASLPANVHLAYDNLKIEVGGEKA